MFQEIMRSRWSWVALVCHQLRLNKERLSQCYPAHYIIGRSLSRHNITQVTKPVQLQIGLIHKEEFAFFILEQATVDIILGRPWLVQHQPEVCWRTGEILRWGENCFYECFPALWNISRQHHQVAVHSTSIESPPEK